MIVQKSGVHEQDEYSNNANSDADVPPLADSLTDVNAKSVIGAAGAGAIVGSIVIGGLITGPVIVGGAAVYATTRSDKIGSAARKVGSKVADAGAYTYAKAKEYDVVGKAKKAGTYTYEKAKVVNEKYDITGKATVAGEAIGSAVMSGFSFANKLLYGKNPNDTSTNTNSASSSGAPSQSQRQNTNW